MMVPPPTSTLILLVDDNPTNLRVLSTAMEIQSNWTILVATDGESAIEQAQYAQPDLILLDVMMPGMDGFETCQQLKSLESTQTIPVIFMTALTDTGYKVRGLELGAVDYITKPFQQAEVIARVKLHLRLSRLSQNLDTQNTLLLEKIAEKDAAEAKLQSLAQDLEQRVLDRTNELSQFLQQLKQTQLQLIQQEKMSALGNLVSGIAHEINNPVGYLQGNIQPAQDYVQGLLDLIDLYQQCFPQSGPKIDEKIQSIDLDFIREDLPKVLNSMKTGVERIYNISISLRMFSRADKETMVLFDIREGIESTLLILKHRLKSNSVRPAIQVIQNFQQIPNIKCFAGQINQVLMNLLANAIDALEERSVGRSFEELEQDPNVITIQTALSNDDKTIKVRIRDNGIGMDTEVQKRAFEHLFTTKGVGKGTGLGLAIAQQIIVQKHQGAIDFESYPGQGTVFTLTLPINTD